jgi:hypothetical protein
MIHGRGWGMVCCFNCAPFWLANLESMDREFPRHRVSERAKAFVRWLLVPQWKED